MKRGWSRKHRTCPPTDLTLYRGSSIKSCVKPRTFSKPRFPHLCGGAKPLNSKANCRMTVPLCVKCLSQYLAHMRASVNPPERKEGKGMGDGLESEAEDRRGFVTWQGGGFSLILLI